MVKLLDGRFCNNDGIIMLDGILYHAWFLKYHPEVFETGQWMKHSSGYIGLPLRKLPGNRWAASKGVYTEIGQNIEYWNKRPDFFASDKINYLDMNKGLISDSVGEKRAYRTPCLVRTVKGGLIDFYCMGHADEIFDLLSYIPAVGKKPSMGWGIAGEWSVKEIDNDYSFVHPEYGLMRPTPISCSDILDISKPEIYPILDYAIKPPYWKPCNFRRCYVPCNP